VSGLRSARFLVPLGAFALLVVVLGVGIKHSPEVGVIVSPLVGKPAPDWTLPSLGAPTRMVGSKDLQGQWYVLNVWGTWCEACRAEHAMLLQVQRSGQVPIIGIDWNDDDTSAAEWLARLGNPYRAVAVDHDGRAAIAWGVYGAPETFLVNPQGVVVYKQVGELTQDVWRQQFLARLGSRPVGSS
jgi:cytochrome c biogenesis protein CcmG, thiol:disulfide interchange protein DsbE